MEINNTIKVLLDTSNEYPLMEINNTIKVLLNILKYNYKDYIAA